MRRLLVGLALCLSTTLVLAQAPSQPWRTIETPHFRVHYPVPFELWAKRTASSLEAIRDQVAAFVGYAPPRRIEVVVGDPSATANGRALPWLARPSVILWAHPADVESTIGDSVDWMDLLSVHELAHVLHLTRPRNKAGLLDRLLPLGPITLTAPRWVIEGYATFVEGALTGSGRPNSSFRAMVVRRFAIAGKLPSYGALSGTAGWLGGSMAYLVGSDFLQWLEKREGDGSLVTLWKRMTSRRGGDFNASFRAVFGESPSDLYDRYRAERTAQAIEEESRRKSAGVVAGELWQRLSGVTASPEVSPDGKRILARREPRPGQGFLAVWTVEEDERERRADEERQKTERRLLEDSNEVADKAVLPRAREPRWKLPRWNGRAPEDPRWMPDSRRVLLARRVPDPLGELRLDLFLWDVESGATRRLTHLADVSDADPSPDGSFAVGVRNRHGVSSLVRVDLATGEVKPLEEGDVTDPWRTWSHPRLSPDSKTIAALLHEKAEWRLVTLPSSGGSPRILADSAVGPPAWSPDGSRLLFGSDASGVWEISSVDARGAEKAATVTRVTGGAFSPAEAPDGRSIFFLELTAKGVDLRRLPFPAEPVEALPRSAADFPILPPLVLEPKRFEESLLPAPHAYRPFSTETLLPASGFTMGPSGNSYQTGVEGSDVVGQLDWMALGAFGNAAGPRGGSLAGSWSGLPAKLTIQFFSALEKPGSQRLAPRPELDEERRGFFAGASWGRPYDGGAVALDVGGGWTRVEDLTEDRTFSRTVGSARLSGGLRRTRGSLGYAVSGQLQGSLGNTAGGFWSQYLAEAKVSGITGVATLSLSARYGDTGGSPTPFDLFQIGGAESSILPSGLDRNRVPSPSLPAALQFGDRLESYRADLGLRAIPLVVYAESLRAWNPTLPRPDGVRVGGAELRLERLLPEELRPNGLSFYAGVARIRSEDPHLSTTQGYGGFVFHP